MIIYPQQAELMAFDFSGLFVNLTITSLEPIRIGLESLDGGIISFFKDFDHHNLTTDYWLIYKTNDGKIELRFKLSDEEYKHNVNFFGGRVEYDKGVSFKLEGNKFKML